MMKTVPNASALRPTGGTREWSRLRADFVERIRLEGSLPCGRCGHPLTNADTWDLGHRIDRALGGTDDQVWPEHATRTWLGNGAWCEGNRPAGGRLGNQLRAARAAAAAAIAAQPGRVW